MGSTASKKQSYSWINLSSYPDRKCSRPFHVSPTEYAIALETQHQSKTFDGLMKYDTIKDKWQEWIKYPEDTETQFHTVSSDIVSKMIYIISSDQLIKINHDTSTSEIEKLNCIHPSYQSSLCVNGEIYLFGASAYQTLLPFELSTEPNIYRQYGLENNQRTSLTRTHSSCYHKSKNSIHLLRLSAYARNRGPNNSKNEGYRGTIWRLDLNQHEPSWNRLDLIFASAIGRKPGTGQNVIAVITKNEKYMLIIGYRKIFVWDFMDTVIKISRVPVPKHFNEGPYRGYISDDRAAYNLLIGALGRKYTRKHTNIANDLVELISSYIGTEWLYLIARQPKNNHCRIQVSTIVEALVLH